MRRTYAWEGVQSVNAVSINVRRVVTVGLSKLNLSLLTKLYQFCLSVSSVTRWYCIKRIAMLSSPHSSFVLHKVFAKFVVENQTLAADISLYLRNG